MKAEPSWRRPSEDPSAQGLRSRALKLNSDALAAVSASRPERENFESTEFLTVAQFAERLGVSRRTVDRWLEEGLPCSVRRGGVVRIDLGIARDWLRTGPTIRKPSGRRQVRIGRPPNLGRSRGSSTA